MAETAPLTTVSDHVDQPDVSAVLMQDRRTHMPVELQTRRSTPTGVQQPESTTTPLQTLRAPPKAPVIRRLLEQEHRNLCRIIKSEDAPEPVKPAVDQSIPAESSPKPASPLTSTKGATKRTSTTSALAAARIGSKPRDASPSLAREIASRRGIPQTGRSQPTPAAQARTRQLSPESPRSTRSGQHTKVPPSIIDSQASLSRAKPTRPHNNDAAFTTFYRNLTTGPLSRLSSALAFAGLPLNPTDNDDDADPEPPKPLSRSGMQTVHAHAPSDPDARKYISPAALAALDAEQRHRPTIPRGLGPAESFYVVPPTGMMTSFADIARRRGFEDEADEDFVDAREAPSDLPPPVAGSRGSRELRRVSGVGQQQQQQQQQMGGGRGGVGKAYRLEELDLENRTLKETLEHLARRLAAFEAHAQDASMAALLTQSMILRPPLAAPAPASASTPQSPQSPPGRQDEGRIAQLEGQATRDAEALRRLREQTRKQERELQRWDQRYAKLAQGAKGKLRARQEQEPDGVRKGGGRGSGGGAEEAGVEGKG
ncbi:hypothetical protein LTR53_014489 [Teratosphaeriaceae sp. CCFEE 6253]|nr:hypothetical protein LTR53_014489 [Teratosphaeriaceae sp. CCFEE 6253]